jgi:aquaporin related protein
LLYIAFAFGVSLAINVAIFADVSGAKFNPAVSHIFPFHSPPMS